MVVRSAHMHRAGQEGLPMARIWARRERSQNGSMLPKRCALTSSLNMKLCNMLLIS